MTLHLTHTVLHAMREHVEHAYPEEACGFLLGMFLAEGVSRVLEAVSTANAWPVPSERARRYEIAPLAFVQTARYARNKQLEIVGTYHSHPDHPEHASDFDHATAWPDLSYVVFSVRNHVAFSCASYRLNEKTNKLELEVQNFQNSTKVQAHFHKFR
jgi:proteasome lid subunit RPN8/RPN11